MQFHTKELSFIRGSDFGQISNVFVIPLLVSVSQYLNNTSAWLGQFLRNTGNDMPVTETSLILVLFLFAFVHTCAFFRRNYVYGRQNVAQAYVCFRFWFYSQLFSENVRMYVCTCTKTHTQIVCSSSDTIMYAYACIHVCINCLKEGPNILSPPPQHWTCARTLVWVPPPSISFQS